MSTIWQNDDGKCHHCKHDLPIGEEHEVVRLPIFGIECSTEYICPECSEWNGWQDPRLGKISSFLAWMGRKFW